MNDWIVWLPSALLAVTGAALTVAVVRLRRRVLSLAEEVALAAASKPPQSADGGFETLASASSSTTGGITEEAAYVVTSVAEPGVQPEPRRIEGSLFADLVLRESVVKGVSFVYGVRRALAPETRNRIRFQMRQEVKRSRKQRRIDLRAARRHLADLQRDEDAA